jgi:hypothetical protein
MPSKKIQDVRGFGKYPVDMDTLDEWVHRATGGKSHRLIADDIGVNHGAFSRWMREHSFPMPYLLHFARKYRVNYFEALCVAGYITEAEFDAWTPLSSVRRASEVDLVQELSRRIVARDYLGDVARPTVPSVPEPSGLTATG